jgi:septal ring factor EnvC (AmiA/AmiB activator)
VTLSRIFRRPRRRQLEAEIANLERKNKQQAAEIANLERENKQQAAEIANLERENKQQAAKIANLTAECEELTDLNVMLHAANEGLGVQLSRFMVPLPGEEREEVERCLN